MYLQGRNRESDIDSRPADTAGEIIAFPSTSNEHMELKIRTTIPHTDA